MILATHYIEPSTYLLGGSTFIQERQPYEHASTTTIGEYSHTKVMSNQVMSVSTCNSNDSSDAGSPPQGGPVSNENHTKNTKRRASRAGTRSVSTLTTAQLARKRANDREAQRAIRQRTKEHIEGLERRIAELTSAENPESRLDEVLQRNASLERELQQLREQVQYGTVESLANKNGSMIEVTSIPAQSPMERPPTGYNQTSGMPGYDGHMNIAMSQPNGGYSTPIATAFLSERNEQPFSPLQPRADIRRHSSHSDMDIQRSWVVPSTLSQTSSPILSEPQSNMSALRMTPLPQSIPGIRVPSTPLLGQPSRNPWELPIRFMPPTGPVDQLLISLLQTRRSLAMGGANHEALVGPYQPSMKSLLYPEAVDGHNNPLAKAITDLLSQTMMKTLPEKAACLFVMYHLLQWQISPLASTYDALPDWHAPRASQLITPHPLWIDQIPWGKLRDRVINNQALYATEEFQQLYTANISINWPYRPLDALVFVADDVHASPLFEKHVLNLENWSLGPGFAQRYPELASVCRFAGFAPEMEGAMCMTHLGGVAQQQQQQQQHHQLQHQATYQI